ncbi:MAG: CHAT domain-containing tetratricopeptide repeat protein [Pseudomonadota bacterium]
MLAALRARPAFVVAVTFVVATDVGAVETLTLREPGITSVPAVAGEQIEVGFDLPVGSSHLLRVSGRDIGLTIQLPDGPQFSHPVAGNSSDYMYLRSDESADMVLTLRVENRSSSTALVELELLSTSSLPAVVATVTAWSREGAIAFAQRTDAARARALKAYQRIERVLYSAEEPILARMRADAIHAQGEIAFFLDDAISTTTKLQAAATQYAALRLADEQATALNSLGLWYQQRQQGDAANEAYDLAAAAVQSAVLKARIQNNRCLLAIEYSQLQEAEVCLEKALSLAQAADDDALVMNVRYFQAGVHSSRGESHRALPLLLDVLRRKDLLDWYQLGTVQNNIAFQYSRLGENATALRYYGDAVRSNRQTERRNREALNLSNLGREYLVLGDFDRARQFFGQSIAIAKQIGEPKLLANALLWLLHLERTNDDWDAAAKTLSELENVQVDTPEIKLRTEIERTRLGIARSDRELAARSIAAAEQIADGLDARLQSQSILLATKVRYAEMLGDAEAADKALAAAIAAFEQQRDPIALAWAYGVQAKRALTLGDLDTADDAARKADRYFQPVRSRIANPDLRARWGGETIEYSDVLVSTAMRRHAEEPNEGYDRLSLTQAIATRAQVLSDALSSDQVNESSTNTTLLQRRSELLLQVARHADFERVDNGERRLNDLLLELDRIDNELAQANPRRADIFGATSVELDLIAEQLGESAALLTIHIGESEGFTWLLDQSGISSLVFTRTDDVRRLAKQIANGLKSRRQVAPEIDELSTLLLPRAPGSDVKTIYISVDGVLSYLPLELLIVPDSAERIGDRYNVVYHPAPAMLGRSDKPNPQLQDTELTLIADPIFASDDPRIGAVEPHVVIDAPPETEPASLNETVWNRLPYASREADAINSLWPAESVREFRGASASREVALSLGGERTDIIHVAAHGIVNSDRPELTGLMLSRYDNRGQPVNGFVGVRDIYGLEIDARLVVLSACDTALGREIRGEGLAGLSRAFLYAGAEQVVASLWQVSDGATAALMARFYEEFRATDDAAEALSQAKRSLRRESRWRDPYFWSGFVLYGLR